MSEKTFRFFVAGGVDQVQLTTGAELVAIGQLDQKLWVALAAPTKGIEFDERTLEMLDVDKDSRIRASELIEAAEWCGKMLNDVEQLAKRNPSLPISAIATNSEEAKHLKETALAVLKTIGKADATELSVEDMKEAVATFNKERWNGDGVIPASSAPDEALKAIIAEAIAATTEPSTDLNGDPGLNAEQIDAFFDAINARAEWLLNGASEDVQPLGEDTATAWSALLAVRSKIDDYFARVNVAIYDSRALAALNREEAEYLAIAAKDLHITSEEVAHFPLARISNEANLPLKQGLNPAWAKAVHHLRDLVITPLLGEKSILTEAEWKDICERFSAHEAWVTSKPESTLGDLGDERVHALAKSTAREDLHALIAEDLKADSVAKAIDSVEKLVRCNRDLLAFANNFVAFRDFYASTSPGIFQIGTLYLDRRACRLCVHVTDAARHAAMAGHSNAYLVYCDLKNASGEKKSIAAAITDGDIDNIMVGRNGVFYDRSGADWDATITRIVENPISVRQAFWTPYKKFLRMIEDQISKRAQAAEQKSQGQIDAAAKATDSAASGQKVPAPPVPDEPKKIDIGVVAALGVAVGGMTAALGLLLEAFFGLGMWMPLGILGLILVISGPSMAIAWMKLRKRNLGPLLDANGWAVNSMARINVAFGKSLTSLAELPEGAQKDHVDPYADKKRPWGFYVFLLLLLAAAFAWYIGKLDAYLPPQATSLEVLGDYAPAKTVANVYQLEEPAVILPAEAVAAPPAAAPAAP